MTTPETVSAALTLCLRGLSPDRMGVAVSGGSDSLSLMLLLSDICKARQIGLFAATVDHGLRPEAASEAQFVADVAAEHGIPHATLKWGAPKGQGNLQAEARDARYALLADWARQQSLTHVCLGHTRDDQAETVLMRLARGSGVDGLGGMRPAREQDGIAWLRPALSVRREDLRDFLRTVSQSWCDDPSNEDTRFDRIRFRQLLADGALPGMEVDTLAETAERMAAAAVVLDRAAAEAAQSLVEIEAGNVMLPKDAFCDLPDDTRWRLLAHCLNWVSSATYRPRFNALLALDRSLTEGERRSLHGCIASVQRGQIHISREPAALRGAAVPAPGLWDSRWDVTGPEQPGAGFHIAALDETGLASVPDWRATGLHRSALVASPAVFSGADLVAAPVAGWSQGWSARLLRDKKHLIETLLSR